MQLATLLFLLRDDKILLAMKKRGVGQGKWNGVGGKVLPQEPIEAATIRECEEEIGVKPKNLTKVAIIDFLIPSKDFHNLVHVYVTDKWEGDIQETEEMLPRWFTKPAIPYTKMWSDDQIWLPRVLAGEKLQARFIFDENDEAVFSEIERLKHN